MRPANWEEKQRSWPRVSVFVAARNEEGRLGVCLRHLARQDYPGDWEVLVGDDASSDKTLAEAEEAARENPRFRIFTLSPSEGPVKGKARVLGVLASEAVGEIFLICDADMEMPPFWMRHMVLEMEHYHVDMLNGTTVNRDRTVFESFQAIDWLLPQGTFAWLSRKNITYTAMGNNMAITRKAYEATGGYLQLPFSLTEDFELFRHARARGFRLVHAYHTGVLGITTPQPGFRAWLMQHIRWMLGFMALPFSQQWIFFAQLLFYPLFLAAMWFGPQELRWMFGALWGMKLVYQAVLLIPIRIHLVFFLPVYELLFWPCYMSCWIGYLVRKDMEWKGRTWKNFKSQGSGVLP